MAKDIRIPKLGMNMKEGRLQNWMKKEGEPVQKGEIVLVVESDKVAFELESPAAGLLHIIIPEGSTVPVGEVVGVLAESPEEYETVKSKGMATGDREDIKETVASKKSESSEAPKLEKTREAAEPKKRIFASPIAKELAKEHNIDLSSISGTGPDGRIGKEDVLEAIRQKASGTLQKLPEGQEMAKEEMEGIVVRERRPLNAITRVMAEQMQRSLQVSAQVSSSGTVDMTEMIRLRQKILEEADSLGFRVTYTELFLRAVSYALKANPIMNSSLIDNEIIIWDEINIGIAVDIKLDEYSSGLVVPVVRNVDKKTLAKMHATIDDLVGRAREHKFHPDDFANHTFTLSNVGKFKASSGTGTPILNQPDVGLLMTRPFEDKPVVVDKEIVIRPMMDYGLTYDHRVVTGGDALRFRGTFEQVIRNPYLLFT